MTTLSSGPTDPDSVYVNNTLPNPLPLIIVTIQEDAFTTRIVQGRNSQTFTYGPIAPPPPLPTSTSSTAVETIYRSSYNGQMPLPGNARHLNLNPGAAFGIVEIACMPEVGYRLTFFTSEHVKVTNTATQQLTDSQLRTYVFTK